MSSITLEVVLFMTCTTSSVILLVYKFYNPKLGLIDSDKNIDYESFVYLISY